MKKFLFILAAASFSLYAEAPKKYEAKNFDRLLGHTDGLSDDLLKMHFKLYQGYVNNTNTLLEKLNAFNLDGKTTPPEYACIKYRLGWEFDGMLLHEYYFDNLGGKQDLAQNDPLMQKIIADFGSYENWKKDFIATGAMRGIGWAILYQEPKQGRLINTWINEHDLGHLAGGVPLLIMDVFEHAYITQFGLERGEYITVFFNNINWEAVSSRFRNSSLSQPETGVILKF